MARSLFLPGTNTISAICVSSVRQSVMTERMARNTAYMYAFPGAVLLRQAHFELSLTFPFFSCNPAET